ncbi:tetratricopeptide repeat protein [Candidatus Riflebacteria bacterium]
MKYHFFLILIISLHLHFAAQQMFAGGWQKIDPNSIEHYEKILAKDPGNVNAIFKLGKKLKSEDKERSYDLFSKVIELDPTHVKAYVERGKLNYWGSNIKKYDPMPDFNKALELEPSNTDALYHRAWVYFFRENFEKSVLEFSDAIRIDPKNSDYYRHRGNNYITLGHYQKAYDDFIKAQDLKTDPNNLYSQLTSACLGLKNWKKAIYYLNLEVQNMIVFYAPREGRTISSSDPEDTPESLENEWTEKWHYFRSKWREIVKLKKSQDFNAEKVLTLCTQVQDSKWLPYYLRGQYYLEMEAYELARKDFESANEERSGYISPARKAQFLLGLGEAEIRCGKRKMGLQTLEKAVLIDPDLEDRVKELKRIE